MNAPVRIGRADQQRSRALHSVSSTLTSVSLAVRDAAALGDKETLRALETARRDLIREAKRLDDLISDTRSRLNEPDDEGD